MKTVPFLLDNFRTQWVRERVSAELDAWGETPEILKAHDFEGEASQHFVLGTDKQGVLWTTVDAFVDHPTPHVFVELRYLPPAMLQGEIVHGGAVTAIIDAFAAGCGVIALRYPPAFATAEQTVHFRRPVLIGQTYLLLGRYDEQAVEEESRQHTAVVRCEMVNEEGKTCAQSDSIIKVPKRARIGVTS